MSMPSTDLRSPKPSSTGSPFDPILLEQTDRLLQRSPRLREIVMDAASQAAQQAATATAERLIQEHLGGLQDALEDIQEILDQILHPDPDDAENPLEEIRGDIQWLRGTLLNHIRSPEAHR